MQFHCEIAMDNDAFREEPAREVFRILNEGLGRMLNGSTAGALLDANGNTVGEWRIVGDKPAKVVEGDHADLLTTGLDGLSGGDDDPAIAELQRAINEGRVIVVVDRAAAQRALGRANR